MQEINDAFEKELIVEISAILFRLLSAKMHYIHHHHQLVSAWLKVFINFSNEFTLDTIYII